MSTFTCLLLCWHTARANRRHTIFNCKTTAQMLYRVFKSENCALSHFVYVHLYRFRKGPEYGRLYEKEAVETIQRAYLRFL